MDMQFHAKKERFEKLAGAVSLVKRNLELDGELFRECRLTLLKKNHDFTDSFAEAMRPRIQYFDSRRASFFDSPELQSIKEKVDQQMGINTEEYIKYWLENEVYPLLDHNPFFLLKIFEEAIDRLANEPPLTTHMGREESESIYFQKCMHKFWQEKFGKPLHGVTADFSNALFSDAVTEVKVRDRINKK